MPLKGLHKLAFLLALIYLLRNSYWNYNNRSHCIMTSNQTDRRRLTLVTIEGSLTDNGTVRRRRDIYL